MSAARTGGVVALRGVVTAGHVAALRARAIEDACRCGLLTPTGGVPAGLAWRPTMYEDPRWIRLQQTLTLTQEFRALGDAPALLAVLRSLCGGEVTTRVGDICRIALPHAPEHATRPHQDAWYVPGPPNLWTAWFPLHPCAPDEGGLAVWSGSHQGPLRPHHETDPGKLGCAVPPDAVWTTGPLEPGDAVIFHGLCVHRAWPNRHPSRPRLSADFRYRPRALSGTSPASPRD